MPFDLYHPTIPPPSPKPAYPAPMERLPTECITGLHPGKWRVSPCLEVCTRDPTLCCLYQRTIPPVETRFVEATKPKQVTDIPPKAEEKPRKCRVCGDTDLDHFYPSQEHICIVHHNEYRRAHYAKRKLTPKVREWTITRPCRMCGKQFQRLNTEFRVKLCPECRSKP